MKTLSKCNYVSKQMYCYMLLSKTIAVQNCELKRNREASDAQTILVFAMMKFPALVW